MLNAIVKALDSFQGAKIHHKKRVKVPSSKIRLEAPQTTSRLELQDLNEDEK